MKKISFLIVLLCAAVSLHAAKVGFLVVGASDSPDALPWEGGDYYDDYNHFNASPERAVYKWFKDTYSATSKSIILIGTLQADNSNVPDDIDVLWVNLDRDEDHLDWTSGANGYDVIFNANVVAALRNFVQRGGNLLLTKQAARLAGMIGRASTYPTTCTMTKFKKQASSASVQELGSSGYKVFDDCSFESFKYALLSSSYDVDRECVWEFATDEARSSFETADSAKVLGVDGRDGKYNKSGFIEFYPKGDYKGTVLLMGLYGYLWSEDNANSLKANVQKLTQNMLDYLSVKPTDASVNWQGWETAASGYIGGSMDAATAPTAGDHIASVRAASYTSSDANVASVNNSTGAVNYNYFGSATITSTVKVTGDGQWVPKNVAEVSKEKSVTVSGGSSSATIGYVLTAGQHLNLANEYGDIPNPDKTTAQWFHTNYVVGGNGQFINPSNAIPDAVQTLWIHSDRKDLGSEDYMTELGGGTFVGKLRTYLAAGKNLFVSKQATRLIGDLQRLGSGVYPTYGASSGGDDSWDYGTHGPYVIGNNFTTPVSEEHSTHAIYKTLGANPTLITADTHTNRNYVININSWEGLTTHEAFDAYQTAHDCRLLGDWGNYPDKYECGGLVEFYPKDDVGEGDNTFNQVGTIMMLGLAAYQWVNPTDNTRTLTSNILSYLNTTSAPALAWVVEPVDGAVAAPQNVQVSFADGAVAWYQTAGDGSVSIDENPDYPYDSEYRVLNFTREGSVTIKAERTGDGYAVPRNVTPTSISKAINVATNIYTRSVTSGNYGTICLPRASSTLEGATFFNAVGKTAEGVVIEEVDALEAGKPYIFEASAEKISVTYTGAAVSEPKNVGTNGLVGSFVLADIVDSENYYILKNNKLYQVNNSKVGANRAYFDLSAMSDYDLAQPVNGRRRLMGIDRPGMPTEVENAEAVKIESRKVIENGQLFIIKNGVKYNAQGQIVK